MPAERLDRQHAHVLLAADLAERGDEPRPVGRHVHVVDDGAVRERVHRLVGRERASDPDDRAQAARLRGCPRATPAARSNTRSPIRASRISRVVRFVAGSSAMRSRHAALSVGEEQHARVRIAGERGHRELDRALDRGEALDGARGGGDRADVRDDPRIVEGGVNRLRARDRRRRATPTRAPARVRSTAGVRGNCRTVARFACWKVVLVRDPARPGVVQRQAEDARELGRVVRAAAVVTRHPLDELLRPEGARHPDHEARAVQVRVGLQHEVDLGAFRHQPERDRRSRAVLAPSSGTPSRSTRSARARRRRPSTCRGTWRCLRGTTAAPPPGAS